MRIPRLAFGLLLAAVVVLGSSLVATNARAHGDGPVVLFRISTSADKANLCPMPTTGKLDWSCGLVGADLSYKIRVVTKEGDRIKLGVQANFRRGSGEKGGGMNSDELTKLPEQTYWFIPGEKLEIPVAGAGPIEVTGEWMDHMPPIPITPNMDPKSGELRIYSPILLKGKNVAIDMEGGSATIDENDRGVVLYGKGEGRFQFALTPFEGAIKGKIALNRLTFEVDGQPYVLVTAAPISRREEAWVRLDAKFVPKDAETTGFIGGFKLNDSSAQN